MERVASWWDDFELWLAGLSFVPQAVLVLAVLIPAAVAIAWFLDRAIAVVFALAGRGETAPTPAPTTEDC